MCIAERIYIMVNMVCNVRDVRAARHTLYDTQTID